jgi:hypothetical protein
MVQLEEEKIVEKKKQMTQLEEERTALQKKGQQTSIERCRLWLLQLQAHQLALRGGREGWVSVFSITLTLAD